MKSKKRQSTPVTPVVNKPVRQERKSPYWLAILFLLVVTSVVFSGVSKLKWTNWDDDVYVYENPLVRQGDLSTIFTSPTANTFNPIVVASWALEWKIAGDDPFIYHLDNLLLHLVCVVLVFLLLCRLNLDRLWAVAGALLFAIHPLRVESVAWITERKDVLYAVFYLLALLNYLRYVDSGKRGFLVSAFIFFVISLLCKIQAVTLAPVLVLVDWFRNRAFNTRVILEKLPFFLVALFVGWLGVHFLKQAHVIDMQTEEHSLPDRIVLGFYAYAVYLVKILVPFVTCTYYPQPVSPKWYHYLVAFSGVVVMVFSAITFRKNRNLAFAIGFFTMNVILLLQIVAAGSAYLADRFTYIASIGIVFFIMVSIQELVRMRPGFKAVSIGILMLFAAGYAAASVNYVTAWRDSDTIWSDVIEKYPRKVVVAYVNRGHYLRRQGQNDRAFDDFNTAIELKEDYFLGYLNRGNIYFDRNENEKARMDYQKCVVLKPGLDTTGAQRDQEAGNIYGNLGVIYARMQKYDTSIRYLNISVKADPLQPNHFKNRALTYFEMGRYNESISDFEEVLKFKPDDADIINIIGVDYLRLGRFQEAKRRFDRAIGLNGNSAAFYLNRSYALANLSNEKEALRDALRAQQMGAEVDPQYLIDLGVSR